MDARRFQVLADLKVSARGHQDVRLAFCKIVINSDTHGVLVENCCKYHTALQTWTWKN